MTSETNEPPPGRRLSEIQSLLDAAMVQLSALEDPELRSAATERAMGAALQHVYAATAERDDHVASAEQVGLAVQDVREALSHLMAVPTDHEETQALTASVAQCLGDLQRVAWAPVEGVELPRSSRRTPFLRASMHEPQLLELRRDVLRPAVPLSEAPLTIATPVPEATVEPPPLTLEQLLQKSEAAAAELAAFEAAGAEDAPEEQPAREPPEPPSFDEQALIEARFGVKLDGRWELMAERARDLMDDLAMLGRMRRCTDPEPWASGDDSEARMLTKVDAIAACGASVFPELVRLLDDRPMPDPELTFGNLYFFLSIAGDDAFDQAIRILNSAELDEPGMLEMCIDAFVFAPHPRIHEAAVGWLTHANADRRYLAVETLRRRRLLTQEQSHSLGDDPDERIIASLALALPHFPGYPRPGAIRWFLSHPAERVVRAALEASMFLHDPSGYERAVQITNATDGGWAEAVMFVAIAGDHDARAVLLDDVAADGSPCALRAMGWYGDITHVPFLLGRLQDGDEAHRHAALDALERLTGAGIVDAGIVPEYAPDDEPFTRKRREYEPPGLLDGDAEAWQTWWNRWKHHANPTKRYRWGRRYSNADLLLELSGESFLQRDRPFAMMELAMRTGQKGLPDYHDLIVRQRRALARLR